MFARAGKRYLQSTDLKVNILQKMARLLEADEHCVDANDSHLAAEIQNQQT